MKNQKQTSLDALELLDAMYADAVVGASAQDALAQDAFAEILNRGGDNTETLVSLATGSANLCIILLGMLQEGGLSSHAALNELRKRVNNL